jgi:hypothetical protein
MREIKGNLFDQKVGVVCIATNGSVKADGRSVMGCGCAADADLLFPGLALQLGTAIQTFGNTLHYIQYYPERGYTICAFPTKNKWDDPQADLELIEEACKDLAASTMPEVTVALPRLGCGAGRRSWEEIKPILERHLDDRFIIVDFENVSS